MFKLSQSPTFWWPVTVAFAADGGRHQKETFDAEFRRVPQSRLREMREAIERGEMGDAEFVREVMAGWRGVSDGGDEVPFSETALGRMMEIPGAAAAVVVAYAEAQSGLVRKN